MENLTTYRASAGEEMQDMREYVKKITETETQKRIAYEVSVSKLECMV